MNCQRTGAFVLIVFALLSLLAGCSEPEPTGYPIQIGEETFDTAPKRVVSLSPALTETLYVLGYGGRVVGVSDFCDRPGGAGELARCGTAQRPDYEAIYALRPEVLVTSVALHEDALREFQQMGVPVVTLERAGTIDGVLANHRTLLHLFEGELKGEFLYEQLAYYADVQISYVTGEVSRYLAGMEEPMSAIFLTRMDFTMATGDTAEGDFLRQLGLVNQAEDYRGWSYPQEMEPDLNPDVIFYGVDVTLETLLESSYYNRTSAATEDRLYAVDSPAFERQSPLMFEAMETMAREAFPEAFVTEKPSLLMPLPEEPEPEPGFFDFITKWFS